MRTLLATLVLLAAPAGAAAAPLGFAPPIQLSDQIAGGEPLVFADTVHHRLIYTAHEGTTHIYRPGFASQTTFTFASNYRNQVNLWTSDDGGRSWKRNDFGGGFATDPTKNTGFSDPDLTQDAGGRIYDTGIDLANDALFSSPDGGLTWDRGTVQCHDGDRPWLAGGKADEVFMATDTSEEALSHRIFQSTDGGQTCSTTSVPDSGDLPGGGSYTGDGKLYYDRARDSLVEPLVSTAKDGNHGVGVGTWKRGDEQFAPHVAAQTSLYAHWPAIALDDAGTLYLVWDTDPRAAGTTGGCDGGETPLPNEIQMAYSKDFGSTWSAPQTIDRPAGGRDFWPWIAAGDAGRVSVVYYQTNKVVDLACENADISIRDANIAGADGAQPQIETADPAGRPVSRDSNICQSGTTCVVTGEDRRLGDFFTNALDEQGCVIIGSGDTTSPDPVSGGPRPISLPLFMRQDSGPALRGGGDCSGQPAQLVADAMQSGTAGQRCRAHRRVRLRLRHAGRLRRATVYVNGHRARVLKGRRLRRGVRVRLPRGRSIVKVQAVTRRGRHLTDVRRYRVCRPG